MADDGLALLLAERAITRVLHRYAQGVDRFALAQVRSCYWDEATDAHLPLFEGPVDEYVRWLGEVLPAVAAISHQITNILIDVDLGAGRAEVEAYCLNGLVSGEPPETRIQCLRYLDRFERRDGEWRILERRVVRDWNRTIPDGAGG